MLIEDELPEGHKAGFVAVVGAPNAGKSTLMNALMAQKIAIVSPRPQTTRTRQLGILTTETYQLVFMDTPGLVKKALHKLDETMVETVVESIDDADVLLWVVDATQLPSASDRAVAKLLSGQDAPVLLAMNKVDLMTAEQVAKHHIAYWQLLPAAKWIVFSAESQAGLSELHQMIIDALPEGPRYYPADQITDVYVRTIAAEMVREQLLNQLREEIPHSLAVQVDEFKERKNGSTYIHATIFTDRESHKKIIIGTKGAQIRKVGSSARREIETLLDGSVYLELRVKVAPKWRRDSKMLERFGYA